jgi:hypothetical protein
MFNVLLQVELFCVNHLINCSLESTEEFISMEFRFTLRDNGMRAAFQLLHMVLEVSLWSTVLVVLVNNVLLVLGFTFFLSRRRMRTLLNPLKLMQMPIIV